MRLDQQCFDKPPEQQAHCLPRNTDQLVLDDGHSQSMVAALTSGPSTDLMGALSSTSLAGGGSFSPYVGAVVDLAKIFGSLRTAVYQYIPALSVPEQQELNLKLNNPPSFRNPKSVLVVGLPAVEAEQLPPLRPIDPNQVFCLQREPPWCSRPISPMILRFISKPNLAKKWPCLRQPTQRAVDS